MADLKMVYTKLYHTLPWPHPIPRPAEVTFRWSRRFTRLQGRCWRTQRIIDINDVYQDERLTQELEHLMAHEAAHFIWHGHPKAFKAFLRSVATPEFYVAGCGSESSLYLRVKAELRPPRYTWQCPSCGRVSYSHRREIRSCGWCAPGKWTPRFRLVLMQDRGASHAHHR